MKTFRRLVVIAGALAAMTSGCAAEVVDEGYREEAAVVSQTGTLGTCVCADWDYQGCGTGGANPDGCKVCALMVNTDGNAASSEQSECVVTIHPTVTGPG